MPHSTVVGPEEVLPPLVPESSLLLAMWMDLMSHFQVGSVRLWETSELVVELVQLQQIRQETAEFAGSFPPNFVVDRIEDEMTLVLPL